MSNEKVIRAFLEGHAGHTPTRDIINGVYVYKGQTLKTNGLELINYSTRIAFKQDNKLYLNVGKYSVTTSKIQSKLRQLAIEYGYNDMTIINYEEA